MVDPGSHNQRFPDLSRSLQELEACDWGEPAFPSYVVTTCHSLRRKPLAELTAEEVRLAIGQQVGLTYLVPLAIELLRPNPLLAVTFYEGDLIKNVFAVPRDFWDERPDWWTDLERIAERFFQEAALMEDSWRKTILPAISEEYERFVGRQPSNGWLRARQGAEPPSPDWPL